MNLEEAIRRGVAKGQVAAQIKVTKGGVTLRVMGVQDFFVVGDTASPLTEPVPEKKSETK